MSFPAKLRDYKYIVAYIICDSNKKLESILHLDMNITWYKFQVTTINTSHKDVSYTCRTRMRMSLTCIFRMCCLGYFMMYIEFLFCFCDEFNLLSVIVKYDRLLGC